MKKLDKAVGGHRPYRWVNAYSHQTSNGNALSMSQGRTEGHRRVKDAIPVKYIGVVMNIPNYIGKRYEMDSLLVSMARIVQ